MSEETLAGFSMPLVNRKIQNESLRIQINCEPIKIITIKTTDHYNFCENVVQLKINLISTNVDGMLSDSCEDKHTCAIKI